MSTLNTHRTLAARAAAVLLGFAAATAWPQGTGSGGLSGDSSGGTPPSSTTPAPSTTSPPNEAPSTGAVTDGGTVGMLPGSVSLNEANPWYFGVSETLTHDTNIFRVPNATSGNISSTSLTGGLSQPFGRQRLYAAGVVSYNNYFGHSSLDNTSYDLRGSLDWETVAHLSGNVGLSFGQSLSAPVVGGTVPTEHRNQSETQGARASVLWGGVANFGLEAYVDHHSIDYSAPESQFYNSHQNTASLTLRWLPSGPLRLGFGYRETRLVQPHALVFTDGTTQRNDVRGKNIDFLFDYVAGPTLNFNGRISRTEQTNSGATNADFSGNTGNAVLSWQITGKTSISAYASRDVGFNTSPFNGTTVFLIGNTPFISTVVGQYQNNQLTTSGGLTARWFATGKITAFAGVRYSRAKLLSTLQLQNASQAVPDTTDRSKVAYLGASWAVTRGWSLGCNTTYENRDVTGTINPFSYNVGTFGCTGQYTWR